MSRLCGVTQNTPPNLPITSLLIASLIVILSKRVIYVLIDNLSYGGVRIKLKSLIPSSDKCRVLGIRVADNDIKWALEENFFNFSLARTPKCCSSSITIKPRLLNSIFSDKRACVHIIQFIFPDSNSSIALDLSLLETNLDNCLTLIPKDNNLFEKLLKCCLANKVVGTKIRDCNEDLETKNIALIIISDLP